MRENGLKRRRALRSCVAVALSTLSLLVVLAAVAAAAVGGREGTPDPRFGKDGRVLTSLPPAWIEGSFSAVAPAADGGLIVAYVAETDYEKQIVMIERLEADGAPDPAFGEGGATQVAGSFRITALAEDAAGGVIYGSPGSIARLQPDGAVDTAFDKAAAAARTSEFRPEQIAIAPDGEIVVAGSYSGGTPNVPARGDSAVMRYEADGSLDQGFGQKGEVSLGGMQEPTGGLGVLADGSILVLGPKVQRISADGTIEPTPEIEPARGTDSMVVFPDGSFAVAASTGERFEEKGSPTCTVDRYGPEGSPDPRFGDDGVFTRAGVSCGDMVAGPEGGLLLAEVEEFHRGRETAAKVIRLTANGAPVAGFGEGGAVSFRVPSTADPGEASLPTLEAATVTSEGRVVLAGGNRDAALVELAPGGTPDPTFGVGGAVVRQMQGPSRTYVGSMAAEPDGELIVTGASDSGGTRPAPFWMRFSATGRLRPTASGASFRREPASVGYLQPIGPRYLYSLVDADQEYLAKWKPDGEPARGFGHDGMARLPRALDASSYVIDADGGATIYGATRESLDMAAYRVTSAGRPDPRFGTRGLAVIGFPGHERSRAAAGVRGPGDDVVLAGHLGEKLALVELGPDGHPQGGFGRQGKVVCGCGAGRPEKVEMLTARGALYVAVGPTLAKPGRATIVKFTTGGALDRTFGRRGHRWTHIGYPIELLARGGHLIAIGQLRYPLGPATLRAFGFDGTPDRAWGDGTTVSGSREGPTRVSTAQVPGGPLVIAGTRESGIRADGSRLELSACADARRSSLSGCSRYRAAGGRRIGQSGGLSRTVKAPRCSKPRRA